LNLPLIGSCCSGLIRLRVTEFDILLVDARLSNSALRAATTRNGSSRVDTVPKGIVSLTLIFFRDTSMPLPDSACRWCDALDQLLIEVSAQPTAIAATSVVREVL
jgi:hypothetical protein